MDKNTALGNIKKILDNHNGPLSDHEAIQASYFFIFNMIGNLEAKVSEIEKRVAEPEKQDEEKP